jgi:hypothetical protein
MSWRIFTHHTLKTILRAAQVFFFVIVPGALLWLHFGGLPKALHPSIVDAAARAGLGLEFERMRLSPIEGLVLDKVRLRSERLPDKPEVAVDRAAVSLDWRQLPAGKVELQALDLRGAQLFLPLAAEGGVAQTLRLTKARARLMLSEGVVSVPLARFNLQGIDVVATGQVALSPSQGPPAPVVFPAELSRALEVIEALDFGRSSPELDLEFTARAGDPASVQLPRIRLLAEHLAYGEVRLRDIRLDASYLDGVLNVQRLSARDAGPGTFDLQGSWNLTDGQVQADWTSALDPAPWLAELRPDGPWDDLSFASPPKVQGSLEVAPGEPRRVQILGSAVAGGFAFRGVDFESLSTGFAWRNGDLYVSDATLGLGGGRIRADLMMLPGDVRLRVDCQADPMPLTALLGERDRANIAKMELEFLDAPSIGFEARGPELDPARLVATGRMQLGRTSIHGSSMDSASAELSFQDLALTLSDIRVSRPEGSGSGAFTYDFGRRQVRLDGIRTTMNPFNVLQWADPKVAAETKPYRFKSPPEVTVGGIIGLQDPGQTRLWANFTAPQGLDYDLLERTLNFGAATGSLEFTGRKIKLDVPSARLYGGSVRLAADIATGQPGAEQKMDVELSRVDFETLTRLYFGYKESKGLVSGGYKFGFVPGKPEQMRGAGTLLVEDGDVFAIPVLGPLSAVLGSILPGTGYQTARKATCDFRVAKGEIRTDNLDVTGQGFSMIGAGSLFYLRDAMDFSVRINAQGVPGVLLYPVSKLLEYVSDGKLSDPQWRPKALPKLPGAPQKKEESRREGPSAGGGRTGRA